MVKTGFKMIEVGEKEIETHLRKWQDILRLRDWDILVKIVKTEWRKSGDVKIDLDDKKAVLLVNHTLPNVRNWKSWKSWLFTSCFM